MKISNKRQSSSRSQTGTESDSCSSMKHEKFKLGQLYMDEKEKMMKPTKVKSRLRFSGINDAKKKLHVDQGVDNKSLKETSMSSLKLTTSVTQISSTKKINKNGESKSSVNVKSKNDNLKTFNCNKTEETSKSISMCEGPIIVGNKLNDSKSLSKKFNGKSIINKKLDSSTIKRDLDINKCCSIVMPSNKKLSETSKLRCVRKNTGSQYNKPQSAIKPVGFTEKKKILFVNFRFYSY